MKIFDITVTLSENTPVYPGDPQVKIQPVAWLERGDPANLSHISCGSHSGTHLDAPRHFYDAGVTVDRIPLSLLMGESRVVDLRGHGTLDRTCFTNLDLQGVERLLLRTDNSDLWKKRGFHESFSALTPDAVEYLIAAGIKLVGIDYLSIEPFGGDGAVHKALLAEGVVILEGIDLSAVPAGNYELLCFPLKVADGDGAPARAVLRRREGGGVSDFDPHSSKWPLA